MMVNIGAFIGPIFASKFRAFDWNYVFIMSSLVICINMIIVIFIYKEPSREKNTDPLLQSIGKVFRNIFLALTDLKFLVFLIIVIGFWAMYNQLFYTLPVFIDQWVDTTGIYHALAFLSPRLASAIGTAQGTIAPEMLSNLDAFYIVIFQILVSSIVMRFKPLNAMISGFVVSSIGIGLWFITQNGFYLFLSLLIFGLGEMSSSPKITEYIGKIAPLDKVALYMGCSFLPMAGGNFLAGILSGSVYTRMADKITLLQQEVAARGLSIPHISGTFTQNDYINRACELMGMNHHELTTMLWNNYHPSNIWLVFSGIGVGTAIVLFLYDRLWLKSRK
jgi:dipeptide/tripeptide permease